MCASYRKQKGMCTSNQIRNVQVEDILLSELQKITAYTKQYKDEFVALVQRKNQIEVQHSLKDNIKEIKQSKQRLEKLYAIVKRLYEDMIEEKLSEERFKKLSSDYDAVQHQLEQRVLELEKKVETVKQQQLCTEAFFKQVRQITTIDTLTPEIIRLFVDKIIVEQFKEVEGTRTKEQTIWIYWNYISILDIKKTA